MLQALALMLSLAASADDPCAGKRQGYIVGESETRLSSDFKTVHRETCVEGGFESIYHSNHLFYKSRELARIGFLSISPSGRYALFESFEGDTTRLRLFDTRRQTPLDVTDGEFAIPRTVNWDEQVDRAVVTYYESHDPSTIVLSKDEQ